jgi:hypothetical protein
MRSTHSADRVLGRLSHELSPELALRTVAQRFVRMHAAVMLNQESSCRSTLAASGFALTRA